MEPSICRATATFVGAGGGVVSLVAPVVTYSVHARATRSFGSQTAMFALPLNCAAGTACAAHQFRAPALLRIQRPQRLVAGSLVGQAQRQARIEKWNREVARVAAVVAGERVGGEARWAHPWRDTP